MSPTTVIVVSRLAALADRLRPRSDDGDVHRDERVEYFELIMDGFGGFLVIYAVALSLVRRDWLVALWYPTAVVALLVVARFVFFRPHVVVGPDVVVLVGVLRAHRVELFRVRRAVAVVGGIRLELTDGSHVAGPGLRTHAGRDLTAFSSVANEINHRIAERFPTGCDGDASPT